MDKRIVTGVAGVIVLASLAACSSGGSASTAHTAQVEPLGQPVTASPVSASATAQAASGQGYPVSCTMITGPVNPATGKPTLAAQITLTNNGSAALVLPNMASSDPTFLFVVAFKDASGKVLDSENFPPVPSNANIQPGATATFNDQTSNGYPVHDQGLLPVTSCAATLMDGQQ